MIVHIITVKEPCNLLINMDAFIFLNYYKRSTLYYICEQVKLMGELLQLYCNTRASLFPPCVLQW